MTDIPCFGGEIYRRITNQIEWNEKEIAEFSRFTYDDSFPNVNRIIFCEKDKLEKKMSQLKPIKQAFDAKVDDIICKFSDLKRNELGYITYGREFEKRVRDVVENSLSELKHIRHLVLLPEKVMPEKGIFLLIFIDILKQEDEEIDSLFTRYPDLKTRKLLFYDLEMYGELKHIHHLDDVTDARDVKYGRKHKLFNIIKDIITQNSFNDNY